MWLHVITCDSLWLHVITCDYMWLHVITCDYMWLHVITCDYMWLHVITCDYKWLQVITSDYMWLHVITCDYMWLHVITCDYMSLHVITCVLPWVLHKVPNQKGSFGMVSMVSGWLFSFELSSTAAWGVEERSSNFRTFQSVAVSRNIKKHQETSKTSLHNCNWYFLKSLNVCDLI